MLDADKQKLIVLLEYTVLTFIYTLTTSYSFLNDCCCIVFCNLIHFSKLNY